MQRKLFPFSKKKINLYILIYVRRSNHPTVSSLISDDFHLEYIFFPSLLYIICIIASLIEFKAILLNHILRMHVIKYVYTILYYSSSITS